MQSAASAGTVNKVRNIESAINFFMRGRVGAQMAFFNA